MGLTGALIDSKARESHRPGECVFYPAPDPGRP